MKSTKLFLFIILLLAAVSSFGQAGVGIGTTTPSGQLHIAGTNLLDTANGSIIMSRYWIDSTYTRASAIYHLYNTAVNKDQLVFGVSGDGGAYTSPLLNNNAKLVIRADGNVGIGPTIPGAKLEVAGGIKVADSINIGGQVRITSGSPAAGKVLTSDEGGVASWFSPSVAHYIGESYGGGIVYYITPDALHGLIAETQDQGFYTWYNALDLVSVSANHSLAGKNFADWRLPTKNELRLLFSQESAVGGFANGNDYYWSSSWTDDGNVWCLNFRYDNYQFVFFDNHPHYVRAVRAF
jgi:Protein of unknown function (DUF1566)